MVHSSLPRMSNSFHHGVQKKTETRQVVFFLEQPAFPEPASWTRTERLRHYQERIYKILYVTAVIMRQLII